MSTKESGPGTWEYEIKTISQTLDNAKSVEDADRKFAAMLNDGWDILRMDVVIVNDVKPAYVERVIIFRRSKLSEATTNAIHEAMEQATKAPEPVAETPEEPSTISEKIDDTLGEPEPETDDTPAETPAPEEEPEAEPEPEPVEMKALAALRRKAEKTSEPVVNFGPEKSLSRI